MNAAIVAQAAGKDAYLIQIQASELGGRGSGAIKIQHAIRRMNAHDQMRFETLHLIVEEF